MSSAKAALESDCRTLAYEAGRSQGVRVNCISAGPLKSRAASAIGKTGDKTFIDLAIDYSKANAPLQRVGDPCGSIELLLLLQEEHVLQLMLLLSAAAPLVTEAAGSIRARAMLSLMD